MRVRHASCSYDMVMLFLTCREVLPSRQQGGLQTPPHHYLSILPATRVEYRHNLPVWWRLLFHRQDVTRQGPGPVAHESLFSYFHRILIKRTVLPAWRRFDFPRLTVHSSRCSSTWDVISSTLLLAFFLGAVCTYTDPSSCITLLSPTYPTAHHEHVH
jgi:hypothetical protein